MQRISLLRDDPLDWGSYPFDVPAIAALESIEITSRVLLFVGENGSGKSTLLEALAFACGFGPEGGSRNFGFSTQSAGDVSAGAIGRLGDALRLRWARRQRDGFFLRAESFYNVASYLDQLALEPFVGGSALAPYGGVSLHRRSHGESFLTLFLERFSGHGLYLLDEPEAALSPARQLALLVRMHDLLEGDPDSQFVIATHSPILLAYPGAQIMSFDGGKPHAIGYRQTDSYAITRRFLENPDRMLRELFDPTEPDEPDDSDDP